MSVFRSNFRKFLFASPSGSGGDISTSLVVTDIVPIDDNAAAGFTFARVIVNASGTWTLSLPDSDGGRATLDGDLIKTTSIPFEYSTDPTPVIEVRATRASDGLSIQKSVSLSIIQIISETETIVLPETGDTPFALDALNVIPLGNTLTITIPVGFPIDYIIPEGI